jgi:TPR repeat protein
MKRLAAPLLLFAMILAAPVWAEPIPGFAEAYSKGDFAAAMRLVRPLAENGDGSAQALLAFMYHDGQGAPRNYPLAYMWFDLAASHFPADSQDFKDARDARDLTGKLMSAEDVANAEAMAQRCQGQKYKNCETQ